MPIGLSGVHCVRRENNFFSLKALNKGLALNLSKRKKFRKMESIEVSDKEHPFIRNTKQKAEYLTCHAKE